MAPIKGHGTRPTGVAAHAQHPVYREICSMWAVRSRTAMLTTCFIQWPPPTHHSSSRHSPMPASRPPRTRRKSASLPVQPYLRRHPNCHSLQTPRVIRDAALWVTDTRSKPACGSSRTCSGQGWTRGNVLLHRLTAIKASYSRPPAELGSYPRFKAANSRVQAGGSGPARSRREGHPRLR